MATYKTRALLLSQYPYREHDKIISCFSEQYGRMDVRAKGARKVVSKLAGNLEPFIEVELLLAHGRRWDILAGTRTIHAFQTLRSQVHGIAAASVCVEAIKLLTRPLAPDARLYQLLRDTLHACEQEKDKEVLKQTVAQFLWIALSYAGFRPELDRCLITRTPVEQGAFSFEGGGVLDTLVMNRDIYAEPLSATILEKLRTNRITCAQSESIVLRYWRHVIDHTELRSWRFLEHITYI